MKAGRAMIALFILVLMSSGVPMTAIPQVQQEAEAKTSADSVVAIRGQVVCINEEIARLRHTKPKCATYGHLLGLKTSDGTIWSFFLNPTGKSLRENDQYIGKRMVVWGRLFYRAKMIEVKRFELLDKTVRKK